MFYTYFCVPVIWSPKLKLNNWQKSANSQSFYRVSESNFIPITIYQQGDTNCVSGPPSELIPLHCVPTAPAILTTSPFLKLPSCPLYQSGTSFRQVSTRLLLPFKCAQCHPTEVLPDTPIEESIAPLHSRSLPGPIFLHGAYCHPACTLWPWSFHPDLSRQTRLRNSPVEESDYFILNYILII